MNDQCNITAAGKPSVKYIHPSNIPAIIADGSFPIAQDEPYARWETPKKNPDRRMMNIMDPR